LDRAALFREVVDDIGQLLRRSPGGAAAVSLSPELAARIEALGAQRSLFTESEASSAPVPNLTGDTIADLAALSTVVGACLKCGLCKTRNNTVFGSGNPHARLVFVGEAPGAEEDRKGLPFVGAAGQLLTDIIVKGMKITRDDVYICNVLKCRPPENRDPTPEEVQFCEPYLQRQLEIIKPQVICCLGRIAAHALLKTTTPLGKLRGTWHSYQGIPMRVTYHPAYLLRNPGDKGLAWEDIKEVMRALANNGSVA